MLCIMLDSNYCNYSLSLSVLEVMGISFYSVADPDIQLGGNIVAVPDIRLWET